MNSSQTHIHIINKFGNAFGGSEQRALRLAQILRKHADVRLWATHPPDPRLLATENIATIDPWHLSFPLTGTFIFIGAYFHIGHWFDLSHPERKIVVLNTDDAANAEKMIERISGHAQNGCEVVYSSARLKSRFRYPGTVEDSPIDIEMFAPVPRAATATFTVGRLSRNYRYKFHEDDPALFRQLGESGVRVRVMGGNCIAGELANTSNIEFIETGAIAAPEFLRSLDCFLYRTSKNWLESYGRVVFEAMASGLPVVCGRDGGYAEHIDNGVNGYLFGDNTEALRIIEQLRRDPDLRRRIGEAARKKVERTYSSSYEQRLVDFYVGKSARTDTTDDVSDARIGKYEVGEQWHFADLEHYDGLRAHATPGVHAAVVTLIQSKLGKTGRVLDLACGSGALAKRLLDNGYTVTACDLIPDKFQASGDIQFVQANLNGDFAQRLNGTFDCICASEIIEHIENPRHFLREIAKLLTPGGLLLLTTPNVDSPFSKAVFTRTGYHHGFSPFDYRESGHITPMPLICLQRALNEAGYCVEATDSVGEHGSKGWWRMQMLARVIGMLDRNSLRKQCLIVLAAKT